jgi:hypothetical protein
MRRRINLSGRQLFWIAAASIGLMALGGGVAYATIPDAAGLIHGCYKQGDATKIGGAPLYVTDSDSGATCKAGDAQLTFAQKGGDAYQAAVDFAALSGQNVTVASVALPAGNFFINAKLYVEDTENGAPFSCTLTHRTCRRRSTSIRGPQTRRKTASRSPSRVSSRSQLRARCRSSARRPGTHRQRWKAESSRLRSAPCTDARADRRSRNPGAQ